MPFRLEAEVAYRHTLCFSCVISGKNKHTGKDSVVAGLLCVTNQNCKAEIGAFLGGMAFLSNEVNFCPSIAKVVWIMSRNLQQRVVNNNINYTEGEQHISMKVLNMIHAQTRQLVKSSPLNVRTHLHWFSCARLHCKQRGLEDFYIHSHIFLCQVAFSSVYKQCDVNW